MQFAGKLELWREGEQELKAFKIRRQEILVVVFRGKISRTSGRSGCSAEVGLMEILVVFFGGGGLGIRPYNVYCDIPAILKWSKLFFEQRSKAIVLTRTKKRKKVSKKDSKESKDLREVSWWNLILKQKWIESKNLKETKSRDPRDGSKTPGPTGRRASAIEVTF